MIEKSLQLMATFRIMVQYMYFQGG